MKGAQTWLPDFLARSPAFASLRAAAQGLHGPSWPTAQELTERARQARPPLGNALGHALAFAHEVRDALGYEQRIHDTGVVSCRANDWHDLLNALVWLSFPRAKATLNARHVDEMRKALTTQRGRVRDALTLFDEGGAIVCASQPHLLECIRAFRWKELFWDHRPAFEREVKVFVFGHAMYEKLLQPFIGVSALAVLLEVDEDFFQWDHDAQVRHADTLTAGLWKDATRIVSPRELAPFPILGVPGWFANNAEESFYANQSYFRLGRGHREVR